MLANPKRTKDEIVQWIRSYFESNGPGCDAVVGISGGKDSSVVAALCVEALGKERVVGVMMPNGEQPDLDDSKQLIKFLGIRYAYTDISKLTHRSVTTSSVILRIPSKAKCLSDYSSVCGK